MPYEVSVDEPSRTIVIKGTGTGTTAETLQLIADQRQTFLDHPGFSLLYDSSELQIESSANDMMQVAGALFDNTPVSFRRIAVVIPEHREGLARIFAALAHPHGIGTDVFTSVSDAKFWLGME